MPEPFDAIYAHAVERKGKRELEASFSKHCTRAALARRLDSEILSEVIWKRSAVLNQSRVASLNDRALGHLRAGQASDSRP